MYLEKVQEIISRKTGHTNEEIVPTAYIQEDLNIGELEFLEIVAELEKEYDIDLSEYKKDVETIEELVNMLTEELE